MSETIEHEVFGTLNKSINDGELHLEGEMCLGDSAPFQLHITGEKDASLEEVLRIAAEAHEQFVRRQAELREKAVNEVITDEELEAASEDLGDELSREDAIESYNKIMIVNYFTQYDEVSVYFENEEGIFGNDINLVADLKFSNISANADG